MRRLPAFALLTAPLLLGMVALRCDGSSPGGTPADDPKPHIPGPHGQVTPLRPTPTPATPNPIPAENALPGDPGWVITKHAGHTLEAYASETSVNKGERIGIHVSAVAPQAVTWELFRLGWYGGDGARLIASSPEPITVGPQPTPTPAPVTGLVELDWAETFAIETTADWVTGVYLVKLSRTNNAATYATFVVRDDARRNAAVLQLPVTTWQAYNSWGSLSLYNGAREVSFDRPYEQGDGSGQLLRYDRYFIEWAESRGFDLVYVTNVDFERNPDLLEGQALFLSIGHDEYWSRTQREAVARAVEHGTHLGFFTANAAFWQIRLEEGRLDGTPRRTQVCYKGRAPTEDPLRGTPLMTVRWRDPAIDEPENALLGVMYSDYQYVDMPWVVANPDAWPYAGTGVDEGDVIPGISGYETDRVFDNGRTPAGLVRLSRSPILTYRSTPEWQEGATYDTPSGAFVFAAATIQWSWGLSKPGVADARVQQITENVFRRAGLEPETGPHDVLSVALPDLENASQPVVILAGSPYDEGWEDGPAAIARFNRPLGAVVDSAGNIYVTDNGNHVVRRIANDAARTVTTIAGTGGAGIGTGPGLGASLDAPSGIAMRADGSLVVVDTRNHRVVRIVPTESGEWWVEHLAGSLEGSSGFASGASTEALFKEPSGIAAFGSDVYVSDTSNGRIVVIDSAGLVTTIVGEEGNGYADGPGATARVRYPTGLRADETGLWVVDSGNRVVRHVANDGSWTTTTIAGHESVRVGGFRDGPAAEARFMPQLGIAAGADALVIADTGNNRVRRIHAGNVRTLAGSGAARGAGVTAADVALALPTDVVELPGGGTLVVCQGDSTLRLLP